MNAPQIIVIAIFLMGLLMSASKHGEPMEPRKWNVMAFIVRGIIWGLLLWWGGFFPLGGAA